MTQLEELQALALNAYADQLEMPAEECIDRLMEFILLELQDTYDESRPVGAAVETLERVKQDIDAMIEAIQEYAGNKLVPVWVVRAVRQAMARMVNADSTPT